MRQNAPAHWLGDSTVEQMWGGSVSVSSAGPVAIPMEAIEAAAKAAVEAALATRIPTTVTISAPSSPARVMGGPPDRSKAPADMQATTPAYVSVSPERPTVGDSSHVAATSEARARLLAAKDAIEEVGSAPPRWRRPRLSSRSGGRRGPRLRAARRRIIPVCRGAPSRSDRRDSWRRCRRTWTRSPRRGGSDRTCRAFETTGFDGHMRVVVI